MQADLEKLEWIKKNQHVCISPWSKAEIMTTQFDDIVVQPCCNFKPLISYEPFSLEPIEKTKAAMNAGYLPKNCSLCIDEERKGLQSERMRYLLFYTLEELKEFERTKKLPFFYLGTKFNNLCNLACRSCDEFNSSLWSKVYDKKTSPAVEADLTDQPEYWENLEKLCLENLDDKRLTFHPKGGETMVQIGFQRVLEWFIEKGYDKKIHGIVITTNFTMLQPRILELLSNFNSVLFEGSIDSVGTNYHYVRWPEKFSTIERSLNTLTALKQSSNYTHYNLMITITWSLNNIFHVPEILDYWHQWMQNNFEFDIQCINLYRPEFLVVDTIPQPYRENLKSIIDSTLNHPIFNNNRNKILHSYLSHLSQALENQNLINEQQFNNYLFKTADADMRNNVRMKDYNKLYDLLTDEHKQILYSYYK